MFIHAPHHIIAIGASAGGMEEINSFFDQTPLDGVSYVIVQHLSASFKSRMVELLSRHSKLIVTEAQNGMIIKSNQVYLIPNDKFMTIHGHTLYLMDKESVKGPHLTINTFFNSLAVDSGIKSIGVILSGLGADGTEGIKAIKKAGGMIIARNPDTSDYGSMPSHAIATGVVDFVLEPESMPAVIEKYVKQEIELGADTKHEEQYVTAIINLINEQQPLDFSEYKRTTILRRIKRRAAHHNFLRLDKYLDFLKISPQEVDMLATDFLISVTAFFRNDEAFEVIQSDILPRIIDNLKPQEELRVWVAGCATGEEAYSLAILIHEQLEVRLKGTIVKIFATDMDSMALANAGKGIYKSSVVKDILPERLDKYFFKEGDNYKIKSEIRRMVIFAQHDLVKNPPYCNIHFISCRNLLIYMTPVLQKKIYMMLLFGLKQNGYLFLGSSESPVHIIQNLEVIHAKWKIYKNNQSKRLVSFDTFSVPDFVDFKHTPSHLPAEAMSQIASINLAEVINDTLVSELDYLIVCIDENEQVVKSYGDTAKYLIQKIFTLNLRELLPRPLAIAFKALNNEAVKMNEKKTVNGIKIKSGQSFIRVNLSVIPLMAGNQKIRIVTFNEDKVETRQTKHETIFDEKVYQNLYADSLEKELHELKGQLFRAYEKLDATNENMQSFNEELLSANEEMQSTNEEMQSVNEELHTINSDYQLKNKELIELNDDLNNYFKSNINGQIFINNDLLLIKFSPNTAKLINLLESDIGRPLSNISTNLKFETIIEDIKKVIDEEIIITKEIETKDNKWFHIITIPYMHQTTDKANGAIITFNDITELKRIQLQLDKNNKGLLRINADLENFIHTTSHDLLAPLNNIEGSIAVINQIKESDPEIADLLSIIDSSIKKFRSLIKDISTIAKIESNTIATENVDLNEIIDNIEWSLTDRIKSSGTIINRDFDATHIVFSKKNLRSILFNLISNGIKYRSSKTPVINIQTKKEKDGTVLSVQDNGVGMDKKHLDKIFDKYARIQTDVEGQGIGLYLAKKIIDSTGGNVVVESEPGIGSKFIIYFNDDPSL